jgi:hypothetical protein
LLDCYQALNPEVTRAMKREEQDKLCFKEKTFLKSLLNSNEMTMTRVVLDRLTILKAIHAHGIEFESTKTEE